MQTDWRTPLAPQSEERAPVFTVLFLLALVGMAAAAFVWSTRSELPIVSVAVGEVKPSSRVRDIQHFEGGIVEEILVREGESVTEGQPLLALSPTRTEADVAEVEARIFSLSVERARLRAQADGADAPRIPDDLREAVPGVVDRALLLFESNRREGEAEIERLEKTADQRRQEIREIETRLRNAGESLKLFEEQFAISAELLRKNITNRYTHLQLQREMQDVRSAIDQDREALKGARAALDVAESAIREARLRRVNEAAEALAKVERELSELSQRVRKFRDSLTRTVLRAPVGGIVKQITVSSVGSVIQPGETVAAIVPADDRLIIEAALAPQEVGYVKPGQTASIRLNSPDLVRFGKIAGTVTEISPDRLSTEDGTPYFRVRIDAEESAFRFGETRYELFPGTQVIANIETGKRTVFDYLTAPVLARSGQALLER